MVTPSGALEANVLADQAVVMFEDRQLYIDCVGPTGARLDMTGYALQWELVMTPTGGRDVFMTKVTDDAGITLASSAGDATLDRAVINLVGDTDYQDARPGLCSHHLRRVDPGQNHVLARGTFLLQSVDVTQ